MARKLSGKTQQTLLWTKRSFVFYYYPHSTQQDNIMASLPWEAIAIKMITS